MSKVVNTSEEIVEYFGTVFSGLDKNVQSAVRHGISQAINAIRDKTKANIASSWFNSTSPLPEGAPLAEGVGTFLYKNTPTAVTHILGTRPQNDGTWRLRFFEGGTVQRTTKAGANRGSIRPDYFFADAIAGAESEAKAIIQKAIDEAAKEAQQNITS